MKQLANLIVLLAIVSLAALLAGWLGRFHFLLDLASHFRVQVAGTLLGCGVMLYILRRPRRATFSLIMGLGLVASLWPFFRPSQPTGTKTYRLLSLNVLTSNTQRDQVIEYIIHSDPDFIVLLETNSVWSEALNESLDAAWPYHESIPRSDNFGIAIYSKLPWIACDVVEYTENLATPSLSASFPLPDGTELRLVATHPLPPMNREYWQSRNSMFANLAKDVRTAGNERTIVAGDLNCSPWSYWFGRLLTESGLRNSAHGHGLNITWQPVPIPFCGLPIDHVLVGPTIQVSQRAVGPEVGSDHRPVIVDFR